MSLPLKAKVAVRDRWSNESSAAAQALAALEQLLGLPVSCEPEWALLVVELDAVYPDKEQLVSAVATAVQAWCRAVTDLLEGEEVWAEEALEQMKAARSRLAIFVEVSKKDSASSAWDSARGGFIVSLPNIPVRQASELIPSLKTHLFAAFDPKKQSEQQQQSGEGHAADDWSDVLVGSAAPSIAPSRPARVDVQYLANIDTLPRPDELLLQPPYHLFVYSRGQNHVEVQSSHGPSLECLAGYLKRWSRANNNLNDRPPMVNVELHQSPFGLGLIHDTLTLVAPNRYGGTISVSPTIVLALVEGILGYERIFSDVSSWHYRKDEPLKRL